MFTPADASPRRLAYDILERVAEGAYADMVLDAALSRSVLDERDRRLVTELVYGVLRLRGRLDFALTPFCSRPLHRLQPGLLWLLRLGAYQLLELSRIPPHAAVSSSVDLARELGFDKATGLINGVLRALQRGQDEIAWPPPEQIKAYLQHVCSMPVWLTKELMRQLPNSEARALAESLTRPAPLSLRVNTLKTDPDSFAAAMADAGHQLRRGTYVPEVYILEQRGENPLPGNAEGWYQVQDEASALIPHLLDPQPGQRILDACAAPGGKTTALAALTNNQAEIIALDKYPQRVELIRQGCERLGCSCVSEHLCDLTTPAEFLEPESFDRVLLDAPCSGLGVLRRNPEGRWNKGPANLKELAQLQRQLLKSVAPLVKPGGKLLYSLCTFSYGESDAVVEAFLQDHPQFELEDLREVYPHWAELMTEQGLLRTYPHRHHGMDAFFAARFKRR